MTYSRRIFILITPGFEIMDLAGPAAVFHTASSLADETPYTLHTLSICGGIISSSAGIAVESLALHTITFTQDDTLLMAGMAESRVQETLADTELLTTLCRTAQQVGRMGSVCAGALVLAAAGLLKGKQATTHWAACPLLAKLAPEADLQPDALYVTDGNLWTSAGVATGMDMALAMLESDLGSTLKGQTARYLVLYAHRPGNQSQFSTLLQTQLQTDTPFAEVVQWMDANLDRDLRVADMADKAGMSERAFHRRFRAVHGQPPAKFLSQLRVERAKQLLEKGHSVQQVTSAVGFHSEAGFRTIFTAYVGISPSLHKKLHTANIHTSPTKNSYHSKS
ncbi:GlxA family transcriptional regulator [Magnetococcus sp. PR-3]|uniref:GlxA family transcriptional regulator n=1 Tax=Magnetococcus sp. PR-3 TaxID=3120355 RepID=UPI002FCDE725